jgi:hypothetical protein
MLVLASDVVWVAAVSAGAPSLAAFAVAGITAKTTNARQKKQLDAEAARQAGELEHDRELADLADLRNLLDQAAATLDLARDALDALTVRLMEWGASLPDEPKDKVEKQGRALDALNARLSVRLGADDPITSHFARACRAVAKTWVQIARLDEEGLREIRSEVHTQRQIFDEAVSAFLAAAVKRAGTVRTKDAV